MNSSLDSLTITRPDDWHLHVRDGEALRTVVPHTAAQFGRAIIAQPQAAGDHCGAGRGLPRPHPRRCA